MLSNSPSLSGMQSLAADARSLGALKMEADKATPHSIRETAKQFESLFMRELIKSMREATMKSGMLDNPGSDLGADLLDQQLAVSMSGQPGGLSDLIAQQLARQMGVEMPATSSVGSTGLNGPVDPAMGNVIAPERLATSRGESAAATSLRALEPQRTPTTSSATNPATRTAPAGRAQADFVARHSATANQVERSSGIPTSFMLGQAGHETGWGRREITTASGENSFNLFGIKAGPGWSGKVAEVTTTEYVNGVAQKKVAKFRAYDSFEDSFKDYARLITNSPRYAQVRTQTGSVAGYANGLQQAGYATDPDYASKLSRAINSTLQLRRAQAQA